MPEQQASGFQQNKVTTTGMTLWDDRGMMLKLSYLDESFSIQLSDPVVMENGKKSYPENHRHNMLMTADRASALYHEVIIKQLLPAYENKETFSKGVFLNRGKTSILEVATDDGELYLRYYKDIDEDRKAKEQYVFHFLKTDLIEGYQYQNGEFAGQQSTEGMFYIFCKYLDMGLNELCKASGHAVRSSMNYTISAVFNHLRGISQKLGVIVEPAFKRNNTGSSGFNVNAGLNEPTNGEEVPFEDVPSVESVEPTDMAGMLS